MFELLDSVLGLLDLDSVSVLNNFSLGVNRRNVLEGANVIFSGLIDLLDSDRLLSSENPDQVLVAHLVGLVLLAVARFSTVGDDLLAGLLANLDDRSDLHQVLLLLLHLSLEVGSSLGSDALLLDKNESLLLSDSLEALLFLNSSSSAGFCFQDSRHSEFFFSLSSEFLLDLLLLLDESDVSVQHIDFFSDRDQISDDAVAVTHFGVGLAHELLDSETTSSGFALSLLCLESGFHLLRDQESSLLILRHDVVDLVSVDSNLGVPSLNFSFGARTRLLSDDDDLASLFANPHSALKSESVFSEFGESFGVLVFNEFLSVDTDLDSPSLDSLVGASAGFLDVVHGDRDFSGLLASGDSVVEDSDVGVDSVLSDGRVPSSDLVVDLFARARLVVDLDDSLAGLLAGGPSLVPDFESVLVESLDLDSDDGDFLVILLDLLSPLVEVVVVAAALFVLHNNDRSAGSGASRDSGSEDVLVLDKSLNLDSSVDELDLSTLGSDGDAWVGSDSLNPNLKGVDSSVASLDSDSRSRESGHGDDIS
jgi:hypothetical protein